MHTPPACANQGNSCFLNASYQLLRRWGRTDEDVQEWRARKLARVWRDGQQHDAHEALLAMLEHVSRPLDATVGELVSVIRCGATDDVSRVSEPFEVLSLPVATTLEQSIASFCHGHDELRGPDVWRSPLAQERGITPARSWKSIDIARWPSHGVVMHFKRFGNTGRKVSDTVELPLAWNGMQLVAVVRHHGRSHHSGHYTALVHTNQWYLCDDSTIVPCAFSARDAYLALYVPVHGTKNVMH